MSANIELKTETITNAGRYIFELSHKDMDPKESRVEMVFEDGSFKVCRLNFQPPYKRYHFELLAIINDMIAGIEKQGTPDKAKPAKEKTREEKYRELMEKKKKAKP